MSYKNLNSEPVRHNHAGFWIRLFATLIDIFIILIVVSIIIPWLSPYLKDFLPLRLLELDKNFSSIRIYLPAGDSPAMFGVLSLAVASVCYIPPTTAHMQGTIGKWLMGIYVGDISGNQISFFTAFFRFFCYAISLAPLGIGFFMIAIDREKRALHDIICRTQVFKGSPIGTQWIGTEDDYIDLYSQQNYAWKEKPARSTTEKKKTVGW